MHQDDQRQHVEPAEGYELSDQQRRIIELMVEDGWEYEEAVSFLIGDNAEPVTGEG